MKATKEILLFFAIIFGFGVFKSSCSDPRLLLSNNSPVTLGSNVTFYAVLEGYQTPELLYFTFNDTNWGTEVESFSNNVTLTREFSPNLYQDGKYVMFVEVRVKLAFWRRFIASNTTAFVLKDDLVGRLLIIRENSTDSNGVDEVAVGENVTMLIDIYDPSGYFKMAQFDYLWSIDWENHPTLNNSLVHKYTQPMSSSVMVSVAVTSQSSFWQTTFQKHVTVKVPVNTVNVSGNPFVHHGEILNLNVSCNGSSPFEYCWRTMNENETSSNLTCTQPIVSTTCNFHITRYFQNYGTYHVGIYISNDVKEVKRVIEVMVYNVSTKPTLSTVIIPIVCSLLTLVIIASGVAFHIQHRKHLAVEVANFDFEDSDSFTYTERTFFEQILDSFLCRNCSRHEYVPNDGESAADDCPILDSLSVDT